MSASNNHCGAEQSAFDIDFELELPHWDFFPVYWLADRWRVTSRHVFNLIESGELPVAIDLRNKASSRTTIRVPRRSVVHFLKTRKNLNAVALTNPKPKARKSIPEGRGRIGRKQKAAKRRASASSTTNRSDLSRGRQKRFCKGVPAFCTSTAQTMHNQSRARGRPKK